MKDEKKNKIIFSTVPFNVQKVENKDYKRLVNIATKLTDKVIELLDKNGDEFNYNGDTTFSVKCDGIPTLYIKAHFSEYADNYRFFNLYLGYTREWDCEMALKYTKNNKKDCICGIAHECFHYCEAHLFNVSNSETYMKIQNEHCDVGNRNKWDNGFLIRTYPNDMYKYLKYFVIPRELMANMFSHYYNREAIKDKIRSKENGEEIHDSLVMFDEKVNDKKFIKKISDKNASVYIDVFNQFYKQNKIISLTKKTLIKRFELIDKIYENIDDTRNTNEFCVFNGEYYG